jgi:dihydroorotate dehydrogenase (NAD+) catalytic subunit
MSLMKVMIAPRTNLSVRNPVIAASGTFGYGTEFAAKSDLSGLGAVVCKGTTRLPRTGNEPLRMVETAAGMLNSIGLQNVGIDAVISEKAPIWSTWRVPVFVNVSATSIDDYRYMASRLERVPGVAGIELNISCPNDREGGVMFGSHPRLAAEATEAVRKATTLPLVVKLSPNVSDIGTIAAAVEAAGADAISLINTLYGMAIDVGRRRPALEPVSGGLSGPAVKPHALHLVYEVAQHVAIPVIGIGGIMSARDALEFLMAGATAIQMGTALLIDPTAWKSVVLGLDAWCQDQGVASITDIVGAANPRFRGVNRTAGEKNLAGR